mmetsp:Transcript_117350/g.278669  ORF Transcript_117350/g.278669 Transcript_117350/m.278669 type:complete len:278 (-) Transcript_117350:297-1130(-)
MLLLGLDRKAQRFVPRTAGVYQGRYDQVMLGLCGILAVARLHHRLHARVEALEDGPAATGDHGRQGHITPQCKAKCATSVLLQAASATEEQRIADDASDDASLWAPLLKNRHEALRVKATVLKSVTKDENHGTPLGSFWHSAVGQFFGKLRSIQLEGVLADLRRQVEGVRHCSRECAEHQRDLKLRARLLVPHHRLLGVVRWRHEGLSITRGSTDNLALWRKAIQQLLDSFSRFGFGAPWYGGAEDEAQRGPGRKALAQLPRHLLWGAHGSNQGRPL